MTNSYRHIFLSPHADDAALSAGGLIHRLGGQGEPVLVVTLFAGSPAAGEPLSDWARTLHERWGFPHDPMAARLEEDQQAMRLLGADYLRLAYRDCIYRMHHGAWLYPSREAIFGEVSPEEELLPNELAWMLEEYIPREGEPILYAPLTVGNHVDHQLTFAAARLLAQRGWRVLHYEDFPYVWREAGALEHAIRARGLEHWQQRLIPLSEEDVGAWVAAVLAYPSQLAEIFGAAEIAPQAVRAYALAVGGQQAAGAPLAPSSGREPVRNREGKAFPLLVLASASPRRRQLLGRLGLPFIVRQVEVEEIPLAGEEPADHVRRLSYAKAAAVAGRKQEGLVIGADTIVVFEGAMLGKPADARQAAAMLRRLRGREHQVLSGLTVVDAATGRACTRLHVSTVTMRPYSEEELSAYVASGDPLDKAGAYAIQAGGFRPVASFNGCYASIMGLPLGELAAALALMGYPLPVEVGAACSAATGAPCCQPPSS